MSMALIPVLRRLQRPRITFTEATAESSPWGRLATSDRSKVRGLASSGALRVQRGPVDVKELFRQDRGPLVDGLPRAVERSA